MRFRIEQAVCAAILLILGFLIPGSMLPAMAALTFAFVPAFPTGGQKAGTGVLAALSVLLSLYAFARAFAFFLSQTGYYETSTPLFAVVIPAVALIAEAFLKTFHEASFPRFFSELFVLTMVGCGAEFLGVILSCAFGLHYAEGAVSVAVSLFAFLPVVRLLFPKKEKK